MPEDLDWERVARATTHPTALVILDCISQSPRSPASLSRELDYPLANISYHVKRLESRGLIELESAKLVDGAMTHVYRLSASASSGR